MPLTVLLDLQASTSGTSVRDLVIPLVALSFSFELCLYFMTIVEDIVIRKIKHKSLEYFTFNTLLHHGAIIWAVAVYYSYFRFNL